jgi:hypothetical protein
MLFESCTKEETEPTYTVWTYSISYSDYPGTLDDRNYIQVELTNSEFSDFSKTLTAEHKHIWTENQIYNWFIGRDFISYEANQKTAWIITTNHGMLTSRSGNTVYSIIK